MTRGYISIGSNIDKEKNIVESLKSLEQLFGKLIVSSLYESEAVGFSGDSFYNVVVGFDSEMEVNAVAEHLRKIELKQGRTRDCKKFSARTLDLDLILYGDLIIKEERLKIPRDDIEKYAFVLEPLAEIAGDLKHPVSHISYSELWEKFDKSNITQKRIIPPWDKVISNS